MIGHKGTKTRRKDGHRGTETQKLKGRRRFAICINNAGYPASLELRRLYPVVPDSDAAAHGQIRIADESGEDYLFPMEDFLRLEE